MNTNKSGEIIQLKKQIRQQKKVFKWLLGYTDFPSRREDEKGNFYWRKHLRVKLEKIGITIK